jgi:hypothetical protein
MASASNAVTSPVAGTEQPSNSTFTAQDNSTVAIPKKDNEKIVPASEAPGTAHKDNKAALVSHGRGGIDVPI